MLNDEYNVEEDWYLCSHRMICYEIWSQTTLQNYVGWRESQNAATKKKINYKVLQNDESNSWHANEELIIYDNEYKRSYQR